MLSKYKLNQLYFKDTQFANLMTRRIFNVLLIANPYDAFMLEDDGRIDEKIFNEYTPKDLYVSAEYSFTSSILTAYCERNRVRHINVMHGEKTFFIREAFSRFHIFYVWDDFYIKLFHQLRANRTEYVVCRQNIPDFVR